MIFSEGNVYFSVDEMKNLTTIFGENPVVVIENDGYKVNDKYKLSLEELRNAIKGQYVFPLETPFVPPVEQVQLVVAQPVQQQQVAVEQAEQANDVITLPSIDLPVIDDSEKQVTKLKESRNLFRALLLKTYREKFLFDEMRQFYLDGHCSQDEYITTTTTMFDNIDKEKFLNAAHFVHMHLNQCVWFDIYKNLSVSNKRLIMMGEPNLGYGTSNYADECAALLLSEFDSTDKSDVLNDFVILGARRLSDDMLCRVACRFGKITSTPIVDQIRIRKLFPKNVDVFHIIAKRCEGQEFVNEYRQALVAAGIFV